MYVKLSPDFVEIKPGPGIAVDLRYATTNNFTGLNLYQEFDRAYLHRDAADRLERAVHFLRQRHPEYRIVIYDALRPRSVQRKLWAHVRDTPQRIYVADPERGSVHNYGLAIDCSILDDRGVALDMGTEFDFFGPLAQPRLEEEHRTQGALTDVQLANRRVLREAMESAGFHQLPHEWWHYDAVTRDALAGRYSLVE